MVYTYPEWLRREAARRRRRTIALALLVAVVAAFASYELVSDLVALLAVLR